MTGTPFDRTTSSIPVVIVTTPGAERFADQNAAILRLQPEHHDHAAGTECVACAARSDIRAMLFDLLSEVRFGMRQPFKSVVVDASQLRDRQSVVEQLDPHKAPARALRDHTVAKSFHLSRVI